MASTRTSQSKTSSEKSSGATQKASRTRSTNAIALLKNDHRTVEDLFDEYEHARRGDRKKILVQQICEELTLHAQLEEQAFYPEAQKVLGDEADLIEEARVEHASLKWLIAQLESEEFGSEQYSAKVLVLKEYVQHHVREEEKEMFPKLRKTELDLDELGETLQSVKAQLQENLPETTH